MNGLYRRSEYGDVIYGSDDGKMVNVMIRHELTCGGLTMHKDGLSMDSAECYDWLYGQILLRPHLIQ